MQWCEGLIDDFWVKRKHYCRQEEKLAPYKMKDYSIILGFAEDFDSAFIEKRDKSKRLYTIHLVVSQSLPRGVPTKSSMYESIRT